MGAEGSKAAADARSPAPSDGASDAPATCPMREAPGGVAPPAATASTSAPTPAGGTASAADAGSGCPFGGRKAAAAPANASACSSDTVSPPEGEVLDPRNRMPLLPQTKGPQQTAELSTDRVISSIPKSGAGENWKYPSHQQFYWALLRKNKEAEEEDIASIVRTHNTTNEITWQSVLEWEKLHERSCATPSLTRFEGRDSDLSLGGWFSSRFSYRGKPFDRHDWYVDRCGQRVVRYVIDFYDDPKAGNVQEITVEARPALDNFAALADRCRRPGWQVKRVWQALFGTTE